MGVERTSGNVCQLLKCSQIKQYNHKQLDVLQIISSYLFANERFSKKK